MKKLAVFAAAALMMVSANLYSQPAEGKGYQKILAKLNLTEEQKKNVDNIRLDMQKQEIAQKAKIQTARVELQQLFKSDGLDKSVIEKKMNEIAKLELQAKMIMIDSWFAVNKVLTPEQQKTWKKVLENVPAMRQKMMKHQRMEKGKMPPEPPAPQK